MKQYLELMRDVRENGVRKADRTGTGTLSVFGRQMRFDISGYKLPLVTTKDCHLKSIVHELVWFLQGTGDTDYLNTHDVNIWNEWTRNKVFSELIVAERVAAIKGTKAGELTEAFEAYRATLYSDVEIPGWEFMPLQGKYRAPDINEQLHHWLDTNTSVKRHKLIKGDLGPVYGVQWRQWPVEKSEGSLTRRMAVRYIESIGKLDELKERIAIIAQDDLDLWMIAYAKNTDRMLPDLYPVDMVILGWLQEHGYAVTETITTKSVDQIHKVIELLRNSPDSRRIMVSAWNPADLDEMALEPCHSFFQFYSRDLTDKEMVDALFRSTLLKKADHELFTTAEADVDKDCYLALGENPLREWMQANGLPVKGLSCQLYQRSADLFLGVPFNIASYALLTKMMAQVVGMEPLEFIWTGGDVHIYTNHLKQVDLQLAREPKEQPGVMITPGIDDIDKFTHRDFVLVNYEPHPAIKAPVAV